jgi:hypothetical protein
LDSLQSVNESIKEKLSVITTYDQKLLDLTDTADVATVIMDAEEYQEAMKLRSVHFRKLHERLSKSSNPTSFGVAVGNDVNLDNVNKFQYLRAQLTGEAAITIVGLSLTSENYNNAMGLLKERYGQKHKIVAAYMKALWGLPSPTGNFSGLRNFYDALESNVCGLNALGKDENSYGDLLVPVILEKLPSNTKRQITRDQCASSDYTMLHSASSMGIIRNVCKKISGHRAEAVARAEGRKRTRPTKKQTEKISSEGKRTWKIKFV